VWVRPALRVLLVACRASPTFTSGSRFLPSLSRSTPSAVSEHSSELIGCPICRIIPAGHYGFLPPCSPRFVANVPPGQNAF
jgi:hypothetical protein